MLYIGQLVSWSVGNKSNFWYLVSGPNKLIHAFTTTPSPEFVHRLPLTVHLNRIKIRCYILG
jgi:hypothetical protein